MRKFKQETRELWSSFGQNSVAIVTTSPSRGHKEWKRGLLVSVVYVGNWRENLKTEHLSGVCHRSGGIVITIDKWRTPLVDAISAALITRNNIIPGPLIILSAGIMFPFAASMLVLFK
jgi:hypothetical protein